jgi:type I restriction enzyme S subunit
MTAAKDKTSKWRNVALGDVCTKIGSGATPRGGKDVYLDDGPYTLIRSQNVYNDGFHRDGLAFIGEGHASELQNVEVFEDDVLLNITGDSVARVCQVGQDVLPARVNQHVAIIRPDSVNLDAGYLRYYLTSPEMQTLLLSWAGSGGTRNALTKGMIESLEIPLLPLPEQRSIAHILGTLDDKIELNRRMSETLEAMARALFHDWFVRFGPTRAKMDGQEPYLPPDLWSLFPDRLADSELGEIPEGWEVKTLGEIVELAYGKALRTIDRKDGPVPVYGSNGQVGWHDKKLVGGPGIVVGRKGNPGVVTWAHGDFFPIDTTFYVVPRDANGSLFFLFFALTVQELSAVSADSAVPGLNRNLAYMNRQLVPDKHALAEFNDFASAILLRCHRLEEESLTLAAQRDALLPKLVTEEVVVEQRTNE